MKLLMHRCDEMTENRVDSKKVVVMFDCLYRPRSLLFVEFFHDTAIKAKQHEKYCSLLWFVKLM